MTSLLVSSLLAFWLQPTPPPDPSRLGPQVGQSLPAFSLPDQDGRIRELASLKGPQGLVLVFFRSADW